MDDRKPFGTRLTEDLQTRVKFQALREKKTIEDLTEDVFNQYLQGVQNDASVKASKRTK